jgi:tight adherence protein B
MITYAALIFVGLVGLFWLAVPGHRVKRSRLGIERPAFNPGKSVNDLLERHGRRSRLAQALNLAGMSTEPGTFVLRVALGSLLVGIVALVVGGPLFALIGFIVPGLVARGVVASKGRQRREAFAAQLTDVMQLLIAALRSGFSMPQALDAVVMEAEEPARGEFERMLAETRIGVDLGTAMKATAVRMESQDLEWVASAVNINRETGGNLAEVLENVTSTVRGRYRLKRHIKTLTAEGRMSIKVLTGLPILVIIIRTLFDEKFRLVMYHGYGIAVMAYCAVTLTIGWIWVRKMIAVKGV